MTFFYALVFGLFSFWTCVVKATEVNRPCVVDGVTYQSLAKTPDPCDRCVCNSGTVFCSTSRCTREWMANLRRLKEQGWVPRQPWDGNYDDVPLDVPLES